MKYRRRGSLKAIKGIKSIDPINKIKNKIKNKKMAKTTAATAVAKEVTLNAKVSSTSVTQTANEVLGTGEKTLYYLIVETENGREIINVGEKTMTKIKNLTK